MKKYTYPIFWFVVLMALQAFDILLTHQGGIEAELNPLIVWMWERGWFWAILLPKTLIASLFMALTVATIERHKPPRWFRWGFYASLVGVTGVLCAAVTWNSLYLLGMV